MTTLTIHKHVNFGEAILIVGDCHQVQWNVQNGIQMEWTQGDIWTTTLNCCLPLNYRYVIVKQANRQIVQWEDGNNRVLNQKGLVHDTWGQIKVQLKILTFIDSNIYVNLYSQAGRTKISMTKQISSDEQYEYQHEFLIPSKSLTQYAYKYQSNEKWERTGARHLVNHPIVNNVIQITDVDPDFNLNYHQITDNIFVGSYFYKEEIHILQKLGIDAILNLQTIDDLINKDMSEDYFQTLKQDCESLSIMYSQCAIKDCNKRSFLQKGLQAYQVLKSLISNGKTVYVHCTDGIQRSIQTIILHLVQDLNYTLENAIELIKSIRARSKPIREVLQQLLEI